MAQVCPACNAQLTPAARFCDECGSPVRAGGTAPEIRSAAAVRKTVTIVFCDLGGSTRFGEHTDAELAREVMARYHAILQGVIDAHGGTVAKFMGDGMMALFGIPEIAEDDAARAVRAGSELQRRFGAFAAEVEARHGEALTMRVGVNTGEVVIADGDADLVGDALNVAARLEKACRPGHVLVGEETWRLTRGEFGYEPLGEVSVAGREQPVSIYEIARETARAAEPVAPFVGRDSEMRRLLAVFEGAVSSRSAQLATVLGSPGVGKTRLSRELCSHVESAVAAVTFEIRCDRAGDATFAPVAHLIRSAAGVGDDADGSTTRNQLHILLAESDEADRERLIEVLGGLVGAAPARSVEEIFWAVRRLVELVAAARPMVIVIDDIQWAEPRLLDLLEHLAEWVSGVPVVLLCLARPELREVRPALTETGRRVTEVLALDGLDSTATEQLAAGLLGTDRLPAGLVARLPVSTDGNPLFVRELVRMLVDDQIISRRGDGEWELTIDADAVEVPPTIQSLLAARVERLPRDERDLLEFASVVGAEFSLGALRELAGAGASIAPMLENMRRKELVEPTGTYWGDEPVHRFHHVLIRDAAYRRLLKTTRADLHERIGVWTDTAAATLMGEHEAAIAYHYEQAYQYRRELGSFDDHALDLGRRGAELLSIAANRALGRDDLAAAGALASRALALLPDADVSARAELLLVGCESLLASGDVVAGRTLVEQLVAVATDDSGLEAWAACFAAQLVGLTDPEALVGADEIATNAATTLQGLHDTAGEAKAHQVRAGLLARLGRVGDAEVELEFALEAARSVDDGRRVTAVLGAAPNAALWGPSPVARAGGRCLDVLRLLRITSASPSVEATSMRCQAVLEALRGRFDVSRSMIASARASLEELGLRHGLMETELFAGIVELIAGDSAAAVAPLRAAYGGLGAMGVGADAGQAAALLSRALLALGEIEEADRMATASEELAGQNLKTAIAWRVARAEVLAARGEEAAGIAFAEAAVEIASATDYMIDHADACVALMGLREAAGDAAGARAARAEALRLYEAKGASVPASRLVIDDGRAASGPPPAPARANAVATTARSERTTVDRRAAPAERRTPHAENMATRLAARYAELLLAGHFDDADALYASDHVFVDRRRVVSAGTIIGGDALAASFRAFVDLGFTNLTIEPIAVRGERSHVSRLAISTTDGREVVLLGLTETDASEFVYTAWFDEDDLDAALDELEDRYCAGEGADHEYIVRRIGDFLRAYQRRDWDAVAAVYARECVAVDHRRLGHPLSDRASIVAMLRALVDLVPDVVHRYRTLEVRGDVSLTCAEAVGTATGGSSYSWMFCSITQFVGGRGVRVEVFDAEQYDEAHARFDELAAETRTPHVDNATVRLIRRVVWMLKFGDLEREEEQLFDRDIVRIDRRRGIASPTMHGSTAIIDNLRAAYGVFGDVTIEPLAVRGERLALANLNYISAEGFESPGLAIYELGEAGSLCRIEIYDEADLAAILDELDARYEQIRGSEAGACERTLARDRDAFHRRDFGALEQFYAPEFVVADHRLLGFPTADREEYLERSRDFAEATSELTTFGRKSYYTERAGIGVTGFVGRNAEGSEYAWELIGVVRVDAQERFTRFEYFPEDQWDRALALFDAWNAAPLGLEVENAASRSVHGAIGAIAAGGDIGETGARFAAENIQRFDRRRGISAPTVHGLAAFNDSVRAIFDVFGSIAADTVAVRGARLALMRVRFAAPDGFEQVMLTLYEVDDSGRQSRLVIFDEEDLIAALGELEDRYCEGEGGEHAYLVRRVGDGTRACAHHDWVALARLFSADLRAADHRVMAFPLSDRASFVGMQQTLETVAAEAIPVFRTLEVRGSAVMGLVETRGMTTDGNRYEWGSITVSRNVAGQVAEIELFGSDEVGAARARFDEWAACGPTPDIDNAVVRTLRRVEWLRDCGDVDRVLDCVADDMVVVDHRHGFSFGVVRGRSAFVDLAVASSEAFGTAERDREYLAGPGERVALARTRTVALSGFEIVALDLLQVDAQGRLCRWEVFDDADLPDALDELDSQYRQIRGDDYSTIEHVGAAMLSAFNHRDWDAFAARISPDVVVVDHAPLGFGAVDRDGYISYSLHALIELAPDAVTIGAKGYFRDRVSIAVTPVTGTTPEGNRYSWLYIYVMRIGGDDCVERIATFAPAQWDDALALFDEWANEPPRPDLERREVTVETTLDLHGPVD